MVNGVKPITVSMIRVISPRSRVKHYGMDVADSNVADYSDARKNHLPTIFSRLKQAFLLFKVRLLLDGVGVTVTNLTRYNFLYLN